MSHGEQREIRKWDVIEALSVFDREFGDDDYEKFLKVILTEKGRKIFRSLSNDGKDHVLVFHTLGNERRSDLLRFIQTHKDFQPHIHNLAAWFDLYMDIMYEYKD